MKDAIANQNAVDEQLAMQTLKVQLAESAFQLKEAVLAKEKITQQLQQEQKASYETRKLMQDQLEALTEKSKQLEKSLVEEKKASKDRQAALESQTANSAQYAALELKLKAAEAEAEKQKGARILQ